MTFHLKKKMLSRKVLSSALLVAALATTGSVAPVRAAVVTPAQWFDSQAAPVFKPGHTMPRLTRFGWDLGVPTQKAIAERWNYSAQRILRYPFKNA